VYGERTVYRIDEQHRMRPIAVERVGETRLADGTTEVLVRSDALQPGTEIVTTQLPNAIDGLLIRIAGENAQ
jgi:hypothetical protein